MQEGGEAKKKVTESRTVTAADSALVKKKLAQLERGDHWLSSNLIVKMADREYKKGRHYNTKVIARRTIFSKHCTFPFCR